METTLSRPLKMLVPLDGSTLAKQAIDYAVALSMKEADIVLLSVVPPARPVRGLLGDTKISAEGVLRRLRADVTASLKKEADRLRRETPGISVDVTVSEGDPAEQIIHEAHDQSVDLIVMASHSRGAIGRLAFGSVTDRVARSADIPVMIIRPHDAKAEPASTAIHRLIVPFDGSELAAQAAPFADSLAQWLNVPIHLVSAIDISQLTSFSLAAGGMFSPALYKELMGGLRQEIEQKIAALTASSRDEGVTVDWTIADGRAIDVIEQETRDGDLIIMTSHGRGGLGRWIIGSVAEKLVREAEVPVIILKARAGPTQEAVTEESDSQANALVV